MEPAVSTEASRASEAHGLAFHDIAHEWMSFEPELVRNEISLIHHDTYLVPAAVTIEPLLDGGRAFNGVNDVTPLEGFYQKSITNVS